MKITVFTSNQPRHVTLIKRLADIADEVYAVQECHSAFPGKEKGFYKKSDTMQEYFSHVLNAEEEVFGGLSFVPRNVRTLALKAGELSLVDLSSLNEALQSDYFIVFGASYIKGALCDWLVSRGAINIHMGISPYYRGNSCNFWAIHDGRPDLVGATIHRLGKGLDSGEMLFHALPPVGVTDPFKLGMEAVNSAQKSLVHTIDTGEIHQFHPVKQDSTLEMRYTRNQDFTDQVARSYLDNLPSKKDILDSVKNRDTTLFTKPIIM
ncbi:formyltransferase family protein [Halobacillus salinus]|uniref:formyltransferase family protein n=1 Tax=Halobacillus salinus TaxID=192814 RepID=UPI0009A666D7|nr:formyltransferase family protein [Halobacillus salinus]